MIKSLRALAILSIINMAMLALGLSMIGIGIMIAIQEISTAKDQNTAILQLVTKEHNDLSKQANLIGNLTQTHNH